MNNGQSIVSIYGKFLYQMIKLTSKSKVKSIDLKLFLVFFKNVKAKSFVIYIKVRFEECIPGMYLEYEFCGL